MMALAVPTAPAVVDDAACVDPVTGKLLSAASESSRYCGAWIATL